MSNLLLSVLHSTRSALHRIADGWLSVPGTKLYRAPNLPLLAVLLSTVAPAGQCAGWPAEDAEPSNIGTYKDMYTPAGIDRMRGRSMYIKDPHVWVYTSRFAKRFGMPEEWIDNSLQGAEALAYKVDWSYFGIKCGYFGEQENCGPSPACLLDVYTVDEAPIPWNTDTRYDTNFGFQSTGMLRPQYKGDINSRVKRRTKRGRTHPIGFDGATITFGPENPKKRGLMSYSVVEFDRDIADGLDYFSGSVVCGMPRQRGLRMLFDEPVFNPSGSVRYQELRGHPERVVHAIDVPDTYMERVQDYSNRVYEPNSLFMQLKKRLSEQ